MRPFPVRDVQRRRCRPCDSRSCACATAGQPVVPVEVDLQPARQPRRHAHMAQPQVFVDEVEVVVQALAVVRYQIGLAGLLVVPRLVGRAGLHGRENADQPRMLARAGQNLFHPVFLPEVPLADELDLDARFRRQPLRVLANPVAEWFGELRIVEDPDLPLVQNTTSSPRQSRSSAACRISTSGPSNPARPRSERRAVRSVVSSPLRHHIRDLFGSGYAGLGRVSGFPIYWIGVVARDGIDKHYTSLITLPLSGIYLYPAA